MTSSNTSEGLLTMNKSSSPFLSVSVGIIFSVIGCICATPGYSSGDIYVHGTLIAEPCTLMPGDEAIEIDFDTIVDNYLYINTRTHPEPFSIHLIDCDVADGEGVKVSFTGNENSNLPGLLALDPGSSATKLGIGIQSETGDLIPINTETALYPLVDGDNTLKFQSFVEAELVAIKSKAIGLGTFVATAVFILNYD